MIVLNDRLVRRRRNTRAKSSVRGIRAADEFWDVCQKVAKQENTSVNELVVREVYKYCIKKSLDN
jgi:predicted DNA-binding ribbon-helix-helix protein